MLRSTLVGGLFASLGPAIGTYAALAYSLVIVAVLILPETRGKAFEQPMAVPV